MYISSLRASLLEWTDHPNTTDVGFELGIYAALGLSRGRNNCACNFLSSSLRKSARLRSQVAVFPIGNKTYVVVGVIVVVYPTPSVGWGAWRKTTEPKKPGISPGSGPEVVERQRVAKE